MNPTSSPAAPQARTSTRTTHAAVHATLLTCIVGLAIYVAQAPAERRNLQDMQAQRATAELSWRLEELRAVVADYRARHGVHPGQGEGKVDPHWFESTYDNTRERTERETTMPRTLAGVPANPVTGRADVRFLAANEPWPEEADETSGWLYRPASGEVRANCRGWSQDMLRRLYDL